MKNDAFLINTSSGPAVDEVALIEVLQHNKDPRRSVGCV